MSCSAPFCDRAGAADYRTADGQDKVRVCGRHKSELERERPEWVQLLREITWLKERRA